MSVDDDLIGELAEAHTGSDFEVVCHRASARMMAMQKALNDIEAVLSDPLYRENPFPMATGVRRILRDFETDRLKFEKEEFGG